MTQRLLPSTLLGAALLAATPLAAQLYVLDDNFCDSVSVHAVEVCSDGVSETLGAELFKLPLGDTVMVERALVNSTGYGLVAIDGRHYGISSGDLLFCDNNPEGVADTFGNTRDRVNHSFAGKLFATMTPYWIVALLFVVAILFTLLGLKAPAMRAAAVRVVPAAILLASLLEIWAAYTLGGSAFWWCSPDRYGFWGSLLRALPYVAFVAFQLYSIQLYKRILLGDDAERELSLKPMAISIGACIPATIVVAVGLALLDVRGTVADVASVATFVVALAIGVWISARRNVAALGRGAGLAFTAFAVVYIIGAAVAIYGLVVVILRLILQILIIVGAILGVGFVMSKNSGGGGSSVKYYDGYGGQFNTPGEANDSRARHQAE